MAKSCCNKCHTNVILLMWQVSDTDIQMGVRSPLSSSYSSRVYSRRASIPQQPTPSPTTSPTSPFPSLPLLPYPFLHSPCREAAPWNQPGGLGERCELPHWGLGPQPTSILVYSEREKTHWQQLLYGCLCTEICQTFNKIPLPKLSLAHLSPTIDRNRRLWQ